MQVNDVIFTGVSINIDIHIHIQGLLIFKNDACGLMHYQLLINVLFASSPLCFGMKRTACFIHSKHDYFRDKNIIDGNV